MKRLILRTLAILLGLLAGLLVGEGIVRVWGTGVPAEIERAIRLTERIDDVPRLGYALRANARDEQRYPASSLGPARVVRYATNRHRLRGTDFELVAPEGTFRIACVGDSFTFGTGVQDLETWPAVLERELRARGELVEVLNAGVMGYDARQQVTWLTGRVLDFEPDLVVLCTYLNDLGPPRKQDRPEDYADLARMVRFGLTARAPQRGVERTVAERRMGMVRRASKLVDLLAYRLHARWNASYTAERTRRGFDPEGRAFEEYATALELARERCGVAGAELHLALYPVPAGLDDYPFEAIHTQVAALASRLGIPFHDLLEPLEALGDSNPIVHPSDAHPSPQAQAAVGRFLALAIETTPEGDTLKGD